MIKRKTLVVSDEYKIEAEIRAYQDEENIFDRDIINIQEKEEFGIYYITIFSI